MNGSARGWTTIAVFVALASLCVYGAPLEAQRIVREAPIRALTGVVVDELSGDPVPGAVVRIEGHVPATMTDSLGHFTLSDFGPGPQVLEVRQFGYLDIFVEVVPPELSDVLVEIPLAPAPIMLEGITAVVDHLATMKRRIESRRRAVAVSSRTYDQERLVRSGAPDMLEFLLRQPSIYPTSCLSGMSALCVIRRGRRVRPRVFIDELPAIGGLDELAIYSPHDLYRMEVYSSGREIRAYTFHFMQRMARRPMALLPVLGGR